MEDQEGREKMKMTPPHGNIRGGVSRFNQDNLLLWVSFLTSFSDREQVI